MGVGVDGGMPGRERIVGNTYTGDDSWRIVRVDVVGADIRSYGDVERGARELGRSGVGSGELERRGPREGEVSIGGVWPMGQK